MGKHNGQILASALPGSGLGRTSAQGGQEIFSHLGRLKPAPWMKISSAIWEITVNLTIN
jgi:hypothetical protein